MPERPEIRAILENKRAEARRLLDAKPLAEWLDLALSRPVGASFRKSLSRPGLQIVAELKRSSPSAGVLHSSAGPDWAAAYEGSGAAAISVLTEPLGFAGSLQDLREVRARVALPVLRKDFLFEPVQAFESRIAGADAVLAIVRFLQDEELLRFLSACKEVGLDVLVEVHDEGEMDRALAAGASIIGVNCRDLARMTTDLAVHERMRPLIPAGITSVAESGIRGEEDLVRVARMGYDAALIGEALMRSQDPGATLRTMRERVQSL